MSVKTFADMRRFLLPYRRQPLYSTDIACAARTNRREFAALSQEYI